MSIDKLQKKIRKLKNPTIVDLTMTEADIAPGVLSQEETFLPAYEKACASLMEALQEIIPAVRFDFAFFALQGAEGLAVLHRLLALAEKLELYVLLDGLDSARGEVAKKAMEFPCDGLVLSPYMGSDTIKNYVENIEGSGKSLFVTLRSPNRSASEMQDLMTGSRLAHQAAADILKRLGEPVLGKCGYSQIAGIGAANAPDSLRTLRSKYSRLFLLIDGYDYSNANAKNCSLAFDQFGHGAVVCSGTGITAAWKEQTGEGDYIQSAVEAAQRMQKNILRYIAIL